LLIITLAIFCLGPTFWLHKNSAILGTDPSDLNADQPTEENLQGGRNSFHNLYDVTDGRDVTYHDHVTFPLEGERDQGANLFNNTFKDRHMRHGNDTQASDIFRGKESKDANSTAAFPLDNPDTSCPAPIQRALGLYFDPAKQNSQANFNKTVLITAVDSTFYELYQNWRRFVENRHGLKHVVVALDEKVYERLDPNVTIPFLRDTANKTGRELRLLLLCSKLKIKLDIFERCPGINFLFSDVDVVFLRDPFQHHLGNLIASNYDFIYSVESAWENQSMVHPCIQNRTFSYQAFAEGNTGFEYMMDRKWIRRILNLSFKRCTLPSNKGNDQALFWFIMRRKVYNQFKWKHCGPDDLKQVKTSKLHQRRQSLCCLDPHFYPAGQKKPEVDVVTFHANAVSAYNGKSTREGKIEKLKTFVEGWID